MRLAVPLLSAVLLAGLVPRVEAQQLSPMTGTTTGAPTAAPAPGVTPAAPATAPTPHRGRHTARQRFEAANTTHDGKLTLDQAKAGHMVRVAQNFDAIDTARKGFVTMDDIAAYNRAQRAARRAR